jgi:argininosuccinate synthase
MLQMSQSTLSFAGPYCISLGTMISMHVHAGEPPYSMDANLLHISYEGNLLEDPWVEAPNDVWTRSVDVRDAPDEPEYIELEFEQGDPVALNGERLSPAVMLTKLNELGGKHGVIPGCWPKEWKKM